MPKYKNLMQFIKENNDWAAIVNSQSYNINTSESRQQIADAIDSALSPENLSCDGELPISQVRARYQRLTAAARELKLLDPDVKFYEYAE